MTFNFFSSLFIVRFEKCKCFSADILWIILRRGEPIQEFADIHGESDRVVQREEAT